MEGVLTMIKTSECSSQSGSRSCVPSHFLLRHFLNQQADALEHWVLDRLPETTPPAMLGLPPHADRLLQRARCRDTLRAVSALFARDGPGEKEEEADDESGGAGGEATSVVRSSQMSRAGVLCCAWLEQVPTELAAAAASGSTDALPRFWRRERQLAAALLCDVRGQLSGLAKAAERHSSSQQPAARVARTRARILASCAVALHAGSSCCSRIVAHAGCRSCSPNEGAQCFAFWSGLADFSDRLHCSLHRASMLVLQTVGHLKRSRCVPRLRSNRPPLQLIGF